MRKHIFFIWVLAVISTGFLVSCAKEWPPEAASSRPVKTETPMQSDASAEAVRSQPKPNHLIHEKSPYLLQHAYNPVDWYPWGEEAFRKAKKEDKPIFLSVGYSTCHWCHVMERESFENPAIAKIMNANFVSIKVDREERPDIDQVYMQAVQAMTGSGGWPMTIFATPDLKPFYGGTYFPPDDRYGRPGLTTVLKSIAAKWKNNRQELLASGNHLAKALQTAASKKQAMTHALDAATLQKAYQEIASRYDGRYGGFGHAPKFPMGHKLSFLLRYWKRSHDPAALDMTEKTLQEMAKGGVYDHLGGGFHRYSTDGRWHIPHFEKMLYDQALLARAYLEAYQATGKVEYAAVARDIFRYVLRDMTSPEGAFYSAEDADSLPPGTVSSAGIHADHPKKSEGAFYVWSEEKIESVLGKTDAAVFSSYYGCRPEGNARSDPHGEFTGKNILYKAKTIDQLAAQFGKTADEINHILDTSKAKLFAEQKKQPRPDRDDKILSDWNGLMISSLAFGSRVLGDPVYEAAARKSADFILKRMKRGDGRLMHRYRDGETAITGFIEDYAFFIHGLVDLYQATFDPRYLEEASSLTKDMIRLFWDQQDGGFFFSGTDGEALITKTKEIYDGAIPSGNSVAALALLRVGRLTMNRSFEETAGQLFDAFSESLSRHPAGYPQMMTALDFAVGPSREIVLAGSGKDEILREMVKEIYRTFLPKKVVLLHPAEKEPAEKIEKLSPFVKNQIPLGGKTTAYICRNFVCDLPATDLATFQKRLGIKEAS